MNEIYHQKELIRLLQFEQERCAERIAQLERILPSLPEGYLAFTNNNYYQVIKRPGIRQQKIISRKAKDHFLFINALREKRYIAKALPILKNNLKFYNVLLKNIKEYDALAIQAALPRHYHDFDCSSIMLKGDVNPERWAKANYRQNTVFRENLIHCSVSGLLTRSKAESMIATRLEENGLIFRYECELLLGDHNFFPDFVILHPTERRLIYWEHFGMMDSPDYADGALNKLRVYSEHGIHLGDNLIITWEMSGKPLTFAHIDDRIKIYLS